MATLINMPFTCDMAQSAATDAGDRSMRQAGRSWWAEEDYNAAVWCWNRLQPEEEMEELCH